MQPSKRQISIRILMLCLLLAVFWTATGALSARHGACDCQPESCPVCLLLLTSRLLRQWLLGLCLLATLAGLATVRAALRVAAAATPCPSLVSAKVKLSC